MSTRPNFFIIGAPKCGTTALSAYLSAHPNVYFSKPKEPHHFAYDLPSFQGVFSDREQYFDLFSDARPHHIAIGEASVWYLYSRDAIPVLKSQLPDARLIIMLRHPADMVYSLYGQWKFTRNEDQVEFETAWHLQRSRMNGKSLPRHLRHPPRLLQYGEIGKYSHYVRQVLAYFPKNQVHFVLFDELIANPKSVYDSVLKFLDLPDDGRTNFPPHNVSKTSRFPLLTLMLRGTPTAITKLLNSNKHIRNLKYFVIRGIDKLNSKPTKRPQLSPKFRQELQEYFADDIRELEHLIDKDLGRWLGRQ
jgi:hypothetical protein